MEPPVTKTRLLMHTAYRTTKQPPISSRIRFDNFTGNNDLDRLLEFKSLSKHVVVAMFLIHREVADFDAEPNFRDGRCIIHSSEGDGARDGGYRR